MTDAEIVKLWLDIPAKEGASGFSDIVAFARAVRREALQEALKAIQEIEATFDKRQQSERAYGAFECKAKLSYLANKEPK